MQRWKLLIKAEVFFSVAEFIKFSNLSVNAGSFFTPNVPNVSTAKETII